MDKNWNDMDLSVLKVISRILHSILVSREPEAVL